MLRLPIEDHTSSSYFQTTPKACHVTPSFVGAWGEIPKRSDCPTSTWAQTPTPRAQLLLFSLLPQHHEKEGGLRPATHLSAAWCPAVLALPQLSSFQPHYSMLLFPSPIFLFHMPFFRELSLESLNVAYAQTNILLVIGKTQEFHV